MGNESTVASEATSLQGQLDAIRNYITQSLEDLQIPGTSVAIVKDNEVILCEGFGYRDLERGWPATEDTLFAIGSSTKAFTTMSVGMLVDDGVLDWDTPVAQVLPEFALHDKFASEQATPRDLATHRVGLPRHEYVWYKAPLSRAQIVERLRHLAPTKPFRTTFQYQNMMYVTLGYLVEKVSDQPWEDFVKSRILHPLGMARTNFSVHMSQQDENFAKPYKVVDGSIQETEFADIDAIGPAGSINSTGSDLANWVQLHLGKGTFRGQRIVSENNVAQMHSALIPTGPSFDKRILFPSYGMGWFTEVYRGYHVVHHGGNIDGFTAIVAMVPEEKLGVVVLTNQQTSMFPRAAAYTIFDSLLGLSYVDWNTIANHEFEKVVSAMREANKQGNHSEQVPNTTPSHDLPAYTGEFEHPAYGTLSVSEDKGQLYVHYHSFVTPLVLEHVHYDVFSVTFTQGEIMSERYQLQFHTDLRGTISSVSVRFEALLPPMEFTRKVIVEAPSRETLDAFVGEYEVAGMTVSVSLRGENTLTVTVPGQPTYELVPVSDTEFGFKGLSGFSVRFTRNSDGTCTEAKLQQPNRTFTARRK